MRNRRLNSVTIPNFIEFGIESTFVRQPSLVDDFYFRKSVCNNTGKDTLQFSDPIYMLFNQERLDRLGPEAVNQWLKALESSGSSKIQSILSKVSDDDLLKMVKSRHIQHPCELERYINDLNERAELFNSEVAKVVAQQNAELENNSTASTQENTDVSL